MFTIGPRLLPVPSMGEFVAGLLGGGIHLLGSVLPVGLGNVTLEIL